jgi:hypothetical protein
MRSGFGFNTNVYETNVVNLAVVAVVVLTVVGSAFRSELSARLKRVLRQWDLCRDSWLRYWLWADDVILKTKILTWIAEDLPDLSIHIAKRVVDQVEAQGEKELQRIQQATLKLKEIEYQQAVADIQKYVKQTTIDNVKEILLSRLLKKEGSVEKQAQLNERYVRQTFRQLNRWSSTTRLYHTDI